jgi:pimeloyl-ACP methyl ester carboxylesterase
METRTLVMRDGVRLVVDRFDPVGPELGAKVVLVHGLASNARFWWPAARVLASMGAEVHTLDLRGHGRSEGQGTPNGVDAAARDLLVALGDIGRAGALVGQSFGAAVVLHASALVAEDSRRAPRLAVLVDGGFGRIGEGYESREEALGALRPPTLDGVGATELEVALRRRYRGFDPEILLAAQASFAVDGTGRVRRRLPLADHMAIVEDLLDYDPLTDAKRLRSRLLVIPALSGDPLVDTAKLAEAERVTELAGGRVAPIKGDHDLHAEHPDLVAELIVEALLARD